MKNIERIQSMSLEQLAVFLCNFFDNCTEKCPGFEYCRLRHKGLLDWLNMEADKDD